MMLCDDCWRETDGYSAHRVAPERRPGECGRCGHGIAITDEDRVQPPVDDSNPIED